MTKKRYVGIVSTGSYVPERIMTNFDLEKIVDTSDEWIYTKTGIKERRIVSDEETTSDLAAKAALRALKNNIRPSDLDLIVLATSSPDMIQPATASLVQDKIGAYNASAFDVSAVCSGFVYALTVGLEMMKGNEGYRTVLVVAAETYSRILDWTDRTTCVYFGDGAGAVVLQDVGEGYGLLSSYLRTDGRYWDVMKFPAGGSRLPATHETINKNLHSFKMDGKKVWEFAVRAFPDAVSESLRRAGLTLNDLDFLISHQANAILINACMEVLGLPMEKTYLNVEKYGNTSSASAAIALDEAVRLGKIHKDDIVVIVGFGGGLTWGADVIRWWK